jgi:hypothetical protein
MKILYGIIGLIIVGIVIYKVAYKPTRQDKAEAAVRAYLEKNLSDPSSYEPVEFGRAATIADDQTTPTDDSLIIISHTYRANNEMGATVKEHKNFRLTLDYSVLSAF